MAGTGGGYDAANATVVEPAGKAVVVSGVFTRPADTTAYASGDLVANSTTAASVVPIALSAARNNGGSGLIRRARLKKSGTGVTNAAFRVHLYQSSPTVTNGDNGAIAATESGYIGHFDVTVDQVFSDASKGIGAAAVGPDVVFSAADGSTNIYALLEARGAYTPASAEVFTLELETLRD